MKNILALIFFLTASASFTQENEVFDFPMEESSLLWEINGKDLAEPSYLFGTIHLISAENYFFPDTLDSLLSHSDALMMEINLDFEPAGLIDLIMLKDRTLSDFFTTEQMDSIAHWAEFNMGTTMETFEMTFGAIKPFVLSMLIENIEIAKQAMDPSGYEVDTVNRTQSYEINLAEKGEDYSLPQLALETIEEQISFFDNLPDEVQAESVMSAVRGDSTESFSLEEYYLSQDVDSIYIIIDSLGGMLSDYQDVFLNKRNENWVPKIAAAIGKQCTFIAVGAGHLGGPKGVIRLLQKAGYTLKPIEL